MIAVQRFSYQPPAPRPLISQPLVRCMCVLLWFAPPFQFTPEQATKAHRGSKRYRYTLSLPSALDGVGGQRHAPTALPRERPGTYCIGGWVGPRAGLDRCGKSRRRRDSIPGPPPTRSESLYRLSYPGFPLSPVPQILQNGGRE